MKNSEEIRFPCGCREAAADFVSAFETDVELRQAWFRRFGPSVDYRPPLPALLTPASRGGSDIRVQLWLWLYLETHARSRAGTSTSIPLMRRDLAARLHLLGARVGNEVARDSRARRIDNALKRLKEENLVARSGRCVELSDHLGQGSPHQVESAEERLDRYRRGVALQRAGVPYDYALREGMFHAEGDTSPSGRPLRRCLGPQRWLSDEWEQAPIRLPVTLWANGWVSYLPAAALLVLFVLFDQQTNPDRRRGPHWMQPDSGVGPPVGQSDPDPADRSDDIGVSRVLQSQYTLGPDVWHKGLAILETEGIVTRIRDGSRGFTPRYRYRTHDDVIADQVRCPHRYPASPR